jgi:hypothetical protein
VVNRTWIASASAPSAVKAAIASRTPSTNVDEPGVVEERADLVDRHGLAQPRLLQHTGEVLAVLPAAGERAVRAGGERQQRRVAALRRRGHGLGTGTAPSCGCPSTPAGRSAARELRLQRGLERAVLRVDRAHPAEVPVVMRDLLQPLIRDPSAARDVAQERDHVVLALGSAEAREQDPVVGDGVSTNSGPLAAGAEAKERLLRSRFGHSPSHLPLSFLCHGRAPTRCPRGAVHNPRNPATRALA